MESEKINFDKFVTKFAISKELYDNPKLSNKFIFYDNGRVKLKGILKRFFDILRRNIKG